MVANEIDNILLKKREIHRETISTVKLPLICSSGSKVGTLIALTHGQLSNDFCSRYYEWREHNADMFLTKFKNSPSKVRNWFQQYVLTDETRQVFLIKDLSGTTIGVCGFYGLTKDNVELDTMIRGESVGHPDLMFAAQRALIWWIFSNLPVNKISGKVLSRNFIVRHFHKQFGFSDFKRTPLTLKKKNGTSEYVTANNAEKKDEELIEIILSRVDYNSDVAPYVWPEKSV